jgi:hypothetical protein
LSHSAHGNGMNECTLKDVQLPCSYWDLNWLVY